MKSFYYTSKPKSYILGVIAWGLSVLFALVLLRLQVNFILYWTLDAVGMLLCGSVVSRVGAHVGFSRKIGEYSIAGDTILLKLANREIVIKELKEISYFEDTLPHVFFGTCWDILHIKYESDSITIQADRGESERKKEKRTLYLLFEDVRQSNSLIEPVTDSKGRFLEDRWGVRRNDENR